MAKFMCMAAYTTETGLAQCMLSDEIYDNTVFNSEHSAKVAAQLFLNDYVDAPDGSVVKWWGIEGEFKGKHGECCFTIFAVPE